MPTSGGYTTIKTFTAATTEAAPTTASTFVTPEFFPGADSLELVFSAFTVGNADNTATIQLWLKSYDASGTEFVTVYDESVATISGSATTMYATPSSKKYTDVPSGSWFIRASSVAGTTAAITGTVRARYYDQDD